MAGVLVVVLVVVLAGVLAGVLAVALVGVVVRKSKDPCLARF